MKYFFVAIAVAIISLIGLYIFNSPDSEISTNNVELEIPGREDLKAEGINQKNFTKFEGGYSADLKNVYYKNEIVIGSDANTFSFVDIKEYGYSLTKDKNHVYYEGRLIGGVDPSSVAVVYYAWPCEKDGCSSLPIFIKDKNAVFRGQETFSSQGFLFKKIEDADPATFEDVKIEGKYANNYDPYSMDKSNVYYKGKKMNADVNSFFAISSTLAKDKNNVYWLGGIIQGADAVTFKEIDSSVSIDKFNLYVEGKILSGVDINTLKVVAPEGSPEVPLEKASSVIKIDRNQLNTGKGVYLKDKSRVYYYYVMEREFNFDYGIKIVETADAKTFKVNSEGIGEDKDGRFILVRSSYGDFNIQRQ